MKTAAIVLCAVVVGWLTAGLVHGDSAGAASAWSYRGATYVCSPGSRVAVFCKETNWSPAYQVAIFPGAVTVSFAGEVIFGCKRGTYPAGNCEYFGP